MSELSEEEIIEILEDRDMLIDTLYENYRQSKIKPFDKAIQGLLDLYQKEKEKNENLELCLKAEEKYSEGLNRDIKSLLNIEPNDDFISKDKIKEKIEEYNIPIFDILDKIPMMPKTIEKGMGAKDGILYVLQELLEERN